MSDNCSIPAEAAAWMAQVLVQGWKTGQLESSGHNVLAHCPDPAQQQERVDVFTTQLLHVVGLKRLFKRELEYIWKSMQSVSLVVLKRGSLRKAPSRSRKKDEVVAIIRSYFFTVSKQQRQPNGAHGGDIDTDLMKELKVRTEQLKLQNQAPSTTTQPTAAPLKSAPTLSRSSTINNPNRPTPPVRTGGIHPPAAAAAASASVGLPRTVPLSRRATAPASVPPFIHPSEPSGSTAQPSVAVQPASATTQPTSLVPTADHPLAGIHATVQSWVSPQRGGAKRAAPSSSPSTSAASKRLRRLERKLRGPQFHRLQQRAAGVQQGLQKQQQNLQQVRVKEEFPPLENESVARNEEEARLLRELKQMGFPKEQEILDSIRRIKQKNDHPTPDAVMLGILSHRDTMEEVHAMDAARAASERRREEAHQRRQAIRKEKEQELQKASLEQWKFNEGFFAGSWILDNKSVYDTLNEALSAAGMLDDTKHQLQRVLKLERDSRKWYKNDLPRAYFTAVVNVNILGKHEKENRRSLRDYLKEEADRLEYSLCTLKEQKGGVPRLFIEAHDKHGDLTVHAAGKSGQDEDEDSVILVCSTPALTRSKESPPSRVTTSSRKRPRAAPASTSIQETIELLD